MKKNNIENKVENNLDSKNEDSYGADHAKVVGSTLDDPLYLILNEEIEIINSLCAEIDSGQNNVHPLIGDATLKRANFFLKNGKIEVIDFYNQVDVTKLARGGRVIYRVNTNDIYFFLLYSVKFVLLTIDNNQVIKAAVDLEKTINFKLLDEEFISELRNKQQEGVEKQHSDPSESSENMEIDDD